MALKLHLNRKILETSDILKRIGYIFAVWLYS
jgi:hypothetical protein